MRIINVVIVYKNVEEVCKYANVLAQQSEADNIGLVIVVNDYGNSNYDNLKKETACIPMQITILDAKKNLGYFNGFLFGANSYLENHTTKPEWFVLSNTDIEYSQLDFYHGFLNGRYKSDTWCVGPSIYKDDTKSYQNPESNKRRTKRELQWLSMIFRHKYLARIYIRLSNLRHSRSGLQRPVSGYVYEIHGAFFAMRYEFIEMIRRKKYGAFLYSEESYVAEELLKAGKKTYYDSEIEIIHYEHSVTGKLSIDKKSKYLAESLRYLIDVYY